MASSISTGIKMCCLYANIQYNSFTYSSDFSRHYKYIYTNCIATN